MPCLPEYMVILNVNLIHIALFSGFLTAYILISASQLIAARNLSRGQSARMADIKYCNNNNYLVQRFKHDGFNQQLKKSEIVTTS